MLLRKNYLRLFSGVESAKSVEQWMEALREKFSEDVWFALCYLGLGG